MQVLTLTYVDTYANNKVHVYHVPLSRVCLYEAVEGDASKTTVSFISGATFTSKGVFDGTVADLDAIFANA